MKTVITAKPFLLAIHFYLILLLAFSTQVFGKEPMLLKGQTLWVPVYTQFITSVYTKEDLLSSKTVTQEVIRQLTTNLAIHNTDLNHSITIVQADYYKSNGALLKSFVGEPLEIKPMAAKAFLIKTDDKSEDWGAKVLIRWQSDSIVNEPIVDSVTIGFVGNNTISINSRGTPIRD